MHFGFLSFKSFVREFYTIYFLSLHTVLDSLEKFSDHQLKRSVSRLVILFILVPHKLKNKINNSYNVAQNKTIYSGLM